MYSGRLPRGSCPGGDRPQPLETEAPLAQRTVSGGRPTPERWNADQGGVLASLGFSPGRPSESPGAAQNNSRGLAAPQGNRIRALGWVATRYGDCGDPVGIPCSETRESLLLIPCGQSTSPAVEKPDASLLRLSSQDIRSAGAASCLAALGSDRWHLCPALRAYAHPWRPGSGPEPRGSDVQMRETRTHRD